MRKFSITPTKLLTLILTGLFCASAMTGCAQSPSTAPRTETPISTEATMPDSYEALYDVIHEINAESILNGLSSGAMVEESTSDLAAPSDAGSAAEGKSNTSSSSNYSETNTQVSGIDEADIVKTDGDYIYVARDSEILIAKADGGNTKEVARIPLDAKTLGEEIPELSYYSAELFINGNTLVVLFQYYPEYATYAYGSITKAACFDVSTPDSPLLITTFGQDGSYSTSRLSDNILYIISNHSLYSGDIVPTDPITYVPKVWTAGNQELIEPSDICIAPDCSSVTYAVVTSIDLSDCSRVDRFSVLGASNTLYMNFENLYLAAQTYTNEDLDSYQDGSFTVTDQVFGTDTSLTKLSLENGSIELVASALFDGYLLNQFSLDEYDGNLRLVLTIDDYYQSTIVNKDGEVVGHESGDNVSTNALFVLDQNLDILGSIEGLAEDERVYSVRFDGDIGYFVTFRETDPLFAVDLSDPTNPQIKDALKIPGFSTYMHIYGPDRLFGLGRNADESGFTDGIKMSMFDTSDPYHLSEINVLKLDDYYAEALYDHKAIFIDPEKNLIGFGTSSDYVLYGYSDEQGFYLVKEIEDALEQTYYGQLRGLYVDDYFYLCTDSNIQVYTLEEFNHVTTVELVEH